MFSQKRTRDEFAVDYEPESQAEYERKVCAVCLNLLDPQALD